MRKYIFNRLLQLIPILLGISIISFFVMHLAPGDPTALFIDPNIDPVELARVRANWGLDQPIYIQYFIWLKNAISLDFGRSYTTGLPVIVEIGERLPTTLLLMIPSFLLTLAITIPIGVISAVRKNSWFDHLFTFLSFAGMAIPTFWLGLMLMLLFSVQLHWLPAVGNLALPLITMTIGGLAGLTRYQRGAMLEVLNQEYIRVARAKGLSERAVIFKHALRNALLPTITIMGLSLPDLFGGAFIIETIFAWPGMGRLGVQAIFQRNYPTIMGIVMLSALLIIVGNLLADIAYAIVDPRIKYEKK
ncbi:MAG: ABC transporter permease [Candidatus Margulisbacteria bacterium]|nr:ABC transporter permease [Candidatus Margulisiibacteriota bacterium]MBU1617698.1 ABC transporter permease [Candidatus Margulisiibacteriota bacterium]MBU1867169.1 ABC transporter permease [Candidatus Margulisiibacteriota bacterium]